MLAYTPGASRRAAGVRGDPGPPGQPHVRSGRGRQRRRASCRGPRSRACSRASSRPNTTSWSRVVKSDPRWQAAMRKRGIDDLDKVQIDNWAVGPGRAAVSEDAGCCARSRISKATSDQFLRPADRRRRRARGHERRAGRRVRSTPASVPLPPPSQELDEKSTGVARGAQAAHHHAARRRELHDRRPGDPLAEVALPLHDAPARRPRAAHRRLRGRGARAADPLSRVALRDGGAVRRPRSRTGAGAARSTSANTAWAGWPARSSRTPTRRRTPR